MKEAQEEKTKVYGSDDAAGLPLEMLTNDILSEEVQKRLLRNYMRSRPADLLGHIQRSAAQGKVVNSFLLLLPAIHERTKEEEKMKDQIMENLDITPEEERRLESS